MSECLHKKIKKYVRNNNNKKNILMRFDANFI